MRCSATRRAERGPNPGKRARSWTRRSISGPATLVDIPPLEGQLHARRKGQARGQGLHLLSRHAIGPDLAVRESGDDQIFEHLLIGWNQKRRGDPHALQIALGAERETHHAAAGLAFNFEPPEFLLRLLKLGLNGL